jgi:hypothetical protein
MSNTFKAPAVPEVKFNKNGYEIRADILGLAKEMVTEDFQVKFAGWQMTAAKDSATGQILTTVEMPQFPGLEKVLETAEKMYSFVNQGAATASKTSKK